MNGLASSLVPRPFKIEEEEEEGPGYEASRLGTIHSLVCHYSKLFNVTHAEKGKEKWEWSDRR